MSSHSFTDSKKYVTFSAVIVYFPTVVPWKKYLARREGMNLIQQNIFEEVLRKHGIPPHLWRETIQYFQTGVASEEFHGEIEGRLGMRQALLEMVQAEHQRLLRLNSILHKRT